MSEIKHLLVVKVPEEHNNEILTNALFIGLISEPTKETMDYWEHELKTDPELGFCIHEDNKIMCCEFTIAIATPEEMVDYINLCNELPENEKEENV